MTKIIGLTGGIGSGKSTVANQFATLGIKIIDTDVIARELVQPGTEVLQKIVEHFGKSILNEQGELNRKALGQIIFSNKLEKAWLENVLHPLIREQAIAEALSVTSPYCIMVIPLLFENRHDYPLDKIVVMDTSIEKQIKRVQQRDQLSEEAIIKIIKQQVSREKRLQHADEIIVNDGHEDHLVEQVKKLHEKWISC